MIVSSVSSGPQSLLPVRTVIQMIRFLREARSCSGRASRLFVICGADRVRYALEWSCEGWHIERHDAQGHSLHATTVGPDALLLHPLIDALSCGQLYTPPLHH